jgi:hypothetical protein
MPANSTVSALGLPKYAAIAEKQALKSSPADRV